MLSKKSNSLFKLISDIEDHSSIGLIYMNLDNKKIDNLPRFSSSNFCWNSQSCNNNISIDTIRKCNRFRFD